MGLLDAFKQYLSDAMPGGLLNPETKPVADRVRYASGLLDPQSQVSQDAQAWHQRTQAGLADQLAGRQTPAAEQAYQTIMGMAGIAPVGMIAGHGASWQPFHFNEARTTPLRGLQKIQPASAETSILWSPEEMRQSLESSQRLQDAWIRVMNEPLPNQFQGNWTLERMIEEQRKALEPRARYVVDR